MWSLKGCKANFFLKNLFKKKNKIYLVVGQNPAPPVTLKSPLKGVVIPTEKVP